MPAPAHLSRVFDRYWNADPRGIGLGLYIARSIVRAHGGEISVRSTLGAGSAFVFTVPRAATPERAPWRAMRLRRGASGRAGQAADTMGKVTRRG